MASETKKIAALSASSSGDNTAIAAVAGRTIKVWKLLFLSAGTVSVTVKDGASTSLSGAMPFVANTGLVLGDEGSAWYWTVPGNALVINLSTNVAITGTIWYTTE